MTREVEDRLRRALAARAEQIQPDPSSSPAPMHPASMHPASLHPAPAHPAPAHPAPTYSASTYSASTHSASLHPSPRRSARRSRWVPALAAAAAAGVLALTGRLVIWPSDGDGAPMAAPTGSAASATAPAPAAATPGPADTTGAAATPGTTGTPDGVPPSPTPDPTPSATVSTDPALTPCSITELAAVVLPDSPSRAHPRTGADQPLVGVTVSVTNTSTHPCRVTGYLGVGLYAQGRLVSGATTSRGATAYAADLGPRTLALAPGASAFADLSWATNGSVTQVDQLRVILPDTRKQLTIAYSGSVGGDRVVSVTALTALPAPLG